MTLQQRRLQQQTERQVQRQRQQEQQLAVAAAAKSALMRSGVAPPVQEPVHASTGFLRKSGSFGAPRASQQAQQDQSLLQSHAEPSQKQQAVPEQQQEQPQSDDGLFFEGQEKEALTAAPATQTLQANEQPPPAETQSPLPPKSSRARFVRKPSMHPDRQQQQPPPQATDGSDAASPQQEAPVSSSASPARARFVRKRPQPPPQEE